MHAEQFYQEELSSTQFTSIAAGFAASILFVFLVVLVSNILELIDQSRRVFSCVDM